jgi:hypothetical protein
MTLLTGVSGEGPEAVSLGYSLKCSPFSDLFQQRIKANERKVFWRLLMNKLRSLLIAKTGGGGR